MSFFTFFFYQLTFIILSVYRKKANQFGSGSVVVSRGKIRDKLIFINIYLKLFAIVWITLKILD